MAIATAMKSKKRRFVASLITVSELLKGGRQRLQSQRIRATHPSAAEIGGCCGSVQIPATSAASSSRAYSRRQRVPSNAMFHGDQNCCDPLVRQRVRHQPRNFGGKNCSDGRKLSKLTAGWRRQHSRTPRDFRR